MKTISLLFLFGLFNVSAFAQAPALVMEYDAAGNRIIRRVIQIQEWRVADTTATEEFEEPPLADGSIMAYPNPTQGAVNIGISPALLEEAGGTYLLVDLSGKEVRSGNITQSQTVLDLTGEANGNYILTVRVGTRKEDWQIIKQ